MSVTVIIIVIIGLIAVLLLLVIANNRDKKDLEKSPDEQDFQNDRPERNAGEVSEPN